MLIWSQTSINNDSPSKLSTIGLPQSYELLYTGRVGVTPLCRCPQHIALPSSYTWRQTAKGWWILVDLWWLHPEPLILSCANSCIKDPRNANDATNLRLVIWFWVLIVNILICSVLAGLTNSEVYNDPWQLRNRLGVSVTKWFVLR